MASIQTLCMDKTGTLTTNRFSLQRLVPLTLDLTLEEIRERLRWFASDSLDQENKSLAAIRAEVGPVSRGEVEVLDQLPFKSQNRYSAIRIRQHKPGAPATGPSRRWRSGLVLPDADSRAAATWSWPWEQSRHCGPFFILMTAKRSRPSGGNCCPAGCACSSLLGPRKRNRPTSHFSRFAGGVRSASAGTAGSERRTEARSPAGVAAARPARDRLQDHLRRQPRHGARDGTPPGGRSGGAGVAGSH